MNFGKHMHDVCPFRIGSRVRVKQDANSMWKSDWPNVYVVTGLHWDYQRGAGHDINVTLATDDEIENNLGDTDGFKVDDLEPAT